MRSLNTFGDLYGDIRNLIRREFSRANLLAEIGAFDERHHYENLVFRLVDLVYGADVGMVQHRGRASLANKTDFLVDVVQRVGAEKLDGNDTF